MTEPVPRPGPWPGGGAGAERARSTDRIERSPILEAAVADGLLLVDPARVRAHGLDASASAIWRATVDAPTVAAVVDRVAGAVGASVDTIDADVRRALVRFADEGLVALGSRPPPPVPGPRDVSGVPAGVLAEGPPVPEEVSGLDWLAPIGPYRGLDVTFDVRTDDATIRDVLAEVWAPLAVAAHHPTSGPVRHLQVASGSTGDRAGHRTACTPLLALDGRVVARPGSAARVVAHAIWHANQLVSAGTGRLLQLHAAGVVVDGVTVLLPAAANSGKSTLAAALVEAGAGYLTDETVGIDRGTGRIAPYPKAITLDPGSWSHFAHLEPAFPRDRPHLAHAKWYVAPDAVRAHAAVEPTIAPDGTVMTDITVGTVVLVSYGPDRRTALERLAPVPAAAALASNTFNLVAAGQPGVETIARLATTVPCWSLSAADVASGAAAITDAAHRS